MKDLFLNIVKVVFGMAFLCFGFSSVMCIISIFENGIINKDFYITIPVTGLFLSLTILTHYLDIIYIEKRNNISNKFAVINLLLSIFFFLIGIYGNFVNYEYELLRLLNVINVILFGVIIINIGLVKICKTTK